VNRSQAIQELEQLIEWTKATFFEGRCPRCEGLSAVPGPNTMTLKTSSPTSEARRIAFGGSLHAEGCPVPYLEDRGDELGARFGIDIVYNSFRSPDHLDKGYFGPVAVIKRGEPHQGWTADEMGSWE